MRQQVLFLLSSLMILLSGCTAEAMYPVLLTALPDSGPPYVYYYAQMYNAFVVERVDGTDSFVLGQGLMQDRNWWWIERVEWSPSGHYLSWLKFRDSAGAVFIVRTDNQPVALPTNTQAYRWAPSQDRVLYETYDEETGAITVVVLDVPRNEVLLTYPLPTDIYNSFRCGYDSSATVWTRDGSGFVYTQTVQVYNQDVNFKTTYWQVSLNGTLSALGEDSDLSMLAEPDCTEANLKNNFISSQAVVGTETAVSPDGRYVISAGLCDDQPKTENAFKYGQCIEDHITGQRAYIHHASVNRMDRWGSADVIWHPTDPWVMIGDINRPAEGECCKFWKIASADGQMQREVMEGYGLLKWLPIRIDTSQFPRNFDSVIPMPTLRVLSLAVPVNAVAWSTDNQQIASAEVESDTQTEVLVWDINTKRVVEHHTLAVSNMDYYHTFTRLPIVCWSGDRLVMESNIPGNGAWNVHTGQQTARGCNPSLTTAKGQYKIDNNQLIEVSTGRVLLDTVGTMVISPNGEYLGAANCTSEVCQIRIVNLSNRETQTWVWAINEHNNGEFFTFAPDSQTLIGIADYSNYDPISQQSEWGVIVGEWTVDGRETRYSIPNFSVQMYRAIVRISPNGQFIGIVGYDTIMIIDRQEQRPIAEYYGISEDFAWSSDSTRFATANATEIRIWSLPQAKEN